MDQEYPVLVVDVTLPGHPLSINEIYTNRVITTKTGKQATTRALTTAARRWGKDMGLVIRAAWNAQGGDPVPHKRLMRLDIHFAGMGYHRDIDSGLKILQDTLVGVVAPASDDRYVTDLHVTKRPGGSPETHVRLWRQG